MPLPSVPWMACRDDATFMTNPLLRRGVNTRRELIRAGHTGSELRSAVKSAQLQRISRGIYADSTDLFAEQRHRLTTRALAQNSPALLVSHISALLLHGVAVWGAPLKKVHFIRCGNNGAGQSAHRIVHSAAVSDDEIVVRDGIKMTSVARSLIDFARSAPAASAVIALDSALHQKLVTSEQLVLAYRRIHRHRGAPAARRALLAADGRSESVGETRTRLAFTVMGLPSPDLQVSIYDEAGKFVGRTDFGFSGMAILVEFDGVVKYSAVDRDPRQSVIAEKVREDALRQLGYVVVRLVWTELADLPKLLAKFEAAIKAGARRMELGGCDGRYRSEPWSSIL